jgi:hypothetical protein
VRWLLANGASPSLEMRNMRRRTPLLMARKLGPHLAVEAELSRHELLAAAEAHRTAAVAAARQLAAQALRPLAQAGSKACVATTTTRSCSSARAFAR